MLHFSPIKSVLIALACLLSVVFAMPNFFSKETVAGWPLADRYAIERPLAVGGMSTLYVARSLATGERVALKMLDPRIAQDAAGVQRFLREVRLTSSIAHPGIVQVRDAGVARGPDGVEVPFLAMELLDGQNLADLIAAGDRTQLEVAGWFRALLSALAAVHAHGVVHRDLKYENVFGVRAHGAQPTIKLIDLGIARELFDARAPTTTGTALGTVYYMAPEQSLDARSVTASADVYAVGVMLYQLLAGVFPFDGESPHAVLVRSHTTPHEPLGERVPGIDSRLAALVDRCLSKDPCARPGNAAALADDLIPLLDDPAVASFLGARPIDTTTFRDRLPTSSPSAPADLVEAVSQSLVPPQPRGSSAPVAPVTARPSPSPSRRAAWALTVLALLTVVAVLAFRARARTSPNPAAPRPAAATALDLVGPASIVGALPPAPAPIVFAPPPMAPITEPAALPANRSRAHRPASPLPAAPLPLPAAPVLAAPPVAVDREPAPVVRPVPVVAPVVVATPPPVPPQVTAPRPEPEAPFTF